MSINEPYICKRCHYSTTQKGHLFRHLLKDRQCPCTYDETSTEDLITELDMKKYNNENKCHACELCNAKFTHINNLKRHTKKSHPANNEASTSNNVSGTGNNNINIQGNNNTANITNNVTIQLREFGNENIDHILNNFQFMYDCFYARDIVRLIEYMYADPAHPENQNVRLQNQRHKLMEKFLNESWKTQDMDDMLQQLVNRGFGILSKHKRDNEDDLKDRLFEDDYEEGEEIEFEREFDTMIRWLVKLGKDPASKDLKKSLYIIFKDLKKANNSRLF
jgi:hypothetical protein